MNLTSTWLQWRSPLGSLGSTCRSVLKSSSPRGWDCQEGAHCLHVHGVSVDVAVFSAWSQLDTNISLLKESQKTLSFKWVSEPVGLTTVSNRHWWWQWDVIGLLFFFSIFLPSVCVWCVRSNANSQERIQLTGAKGYGGMPNLFRLLWLSEHPWPSRCGWCGDSEGGCARDKWVAITILAAAACSFAPFICFLSAGFSFFLLLLLLGVKQLFMCHFLICHLPALIFMGQNKARWTQWN